MNLITTFVLEEKNDEFEGNLIHNSFTPSQTFQLLIDDSQRKNPAITDDLADISNESRDFNRDQALSRKPSKKGV